MVLSVGSALHPLGLVESPIAYNSQTCEAHILGRRIPSQPAQSPGPPPELRSPRVFESPRGWGVGVHAALPRTMPKSRKSLPVLGEPIAAVCPAGARVCTLSLPHRPTKAPPTTGGRARGNRGPYPVCPSSGQWRNAAPLGLSPATEGQVKHWADTDSKGSLPSSLKLFAQLRGGAGRALSLWAGLATPRVPCALGVEPELRAALVPHPLGISLCRSEYSRRHPGLGHARMKGWIPGQDCAPPCWRNSSGSRQGVGFRARPEAAHRRSAKVGA